MSSAYTKESQLIASAALLLALFTSPTTPPKPTLDAMFVNPPEWAKPHTWWHWMAGNVTKEGSTADLEAMKQAGIGGAHIFDAGQGIPAGPVAYNSPEWRALMAHAMSEAQRLGLDMTMHNCSGWSSSGGPWVKPEDAMKRTTFRIENFDGPGVPPAVSQPPTVGGYYQDIATYAIPYVEGSFNRDRQNNLIGLGGNPGQSEELDWPVVPKGAVVNLTAKPNQRLSQGRWVIVRLGYTLTGAHNVASRPSGEGLEVDKLSAKSLDSYLAGCLEPLFKTIGGPVGGSFRTVLIDSYETGFQNWTPTMVQDFRKLRGYDPTPYLPALAGFAVGDKQTTLKFFFDFRRTLADLWAQNYSGHFAKRLKEHGLQLAVEPYGNGDFDPFTYAKPAGLIMGEYWVGEGAINASTKQSASVAHVYGHSVVGAESLTAAPNEAGWRNQPRQWKPFADRSFTHGINRIIYHRFAHQPWVAGVLPGMTMGPWGSHVDRTNTFWSFMPEWDNYLARCQAMLQSGLFVADVCLFTGDSAPQQYTGEGYNLPPVPKGFDFDYCGLDPLMTLKVKDGRLVLPNGASYAVLALPNTGRMTAAVAKKIKALVLAGAQVSGPKPIGSPSLADGAKGSALVAKIGDELWGDRRSGSKPFGKGQVCWGMPLEAVLGAAKVAPDFLCDSPQVSEIHRRIGDVDAYFVATTRKSPKKEVCFFRVSGKVPEIWNPETGEIADATVWQGAPIHTWVELPLEGDGSAFVVFRRPAKDVDSVVSIAPKYEETVGQPAPVLHIVKAEYGAFDKPNGTMDVTALLEKRIDGSVLEIAASNDEMGGDPAFNVVKELRATYEYGGKSYSVTVQENGMLAIGNTNAKAAPFPFEVVQGAKAKELRLTQNGSFDIRWASGATANAVARGIPAPLEIDGPWEVRFPAGWDAPERTTFGKLASWTENENLGIRYFSGTATYTKRFTMPRMVTEPPMRVVLDLGDVRELARVRLNGKAVAAFWKAPFRVDVTDSVKVGENLLEVEVTNLWTNRLIGDEQYPDDMGWEGDHLKGWPEWFLKGEPRPEPRRKTFTTWRHISKDTPLLPSGLLGPVTLRSVMVMPIGK